MCNRVLVFAWLAAIGVVSAAAAIAYGLTAFSDVPHADDWAHIYRLALLENGDMSLAQYLSTRHNGHPVVAGSTAFLLSYHWAALDLRWVRWAMLVLAMGSAALAGTMLMRAADRPCSPIVLLAAPAAVLVGLSLAGWETYSVASNVTMVVSTLCTLASVATFALWQQRGGPIWLASALALAVVSSMNGLHGCLAILALASMALMSPDRRIAVAVPLLLVFAVIATLNFVAGAEVADRQLSLPRMVQGLVMLAGLPWFAPVGARVSPEAFTAVGLVVLPILASLVVWALRQDAATRGRTVPYLALLGVGAGVAIMIAISRSYQPPEHIAASRYVAMLFPGVVGALGLVGIAAERTGVARYALGALFAFAFVGWSLGAQGEFTMAPHRARAHERIRVLATSDAPLPGEAQHFAAPAIAFMHSTGTGLMRPSPAPDS